MALRWTMAKADRWFIEERVRALAVVHLTRRPDLVITESRGDFGPDYVVSIKKDPGRTTARRFGVVLRGEVGPAPEGRANKVLRPTMQSLASQGEYPYPVCLFFFT